MTEDTLFDRLTGESSRRSFLKKSALTSAGVALGASSTGTVAAQDGGTQNGTSGFMFPNQFVANAQFQVDAQIDWTPQGGQQDGGDQGGDGGDDEGGQQDDTQTTEEGALQDQDQSQTQTYIIQYNFSQSHYAFLFVPQETADQIQQGQTYQLGQNVAANQAPVTGTVGVTFSQAGDADGGDGGGNGGGGGDGGGDGGGNGGDGGGDGGDGSGNGGG